MVYPGTTYKTTEDLLVKGTIHFDAAYSEGFEFVLRADTEFVISIWTEPVDEYIQVWLVHPDIVELQIVGQDKMNSPQYNSFSLLIKRTDIDQKCILTYDFSDAIYFYSPIEAYGEFSNFSAHGIEYENVYYPTVEHFFQSQKFTDRIYSERIRKAETPKDASILGRSRDFKIREDWDQMKDGIMLEALKRKFERHKDLQMLLCLTEDKVLMENSPYDSYWGIGKTGDGLNKLGVMLMRVRELIKTTGLLVRSIN